MTIIDVMLDLLSGSKQHFEAVRQRRRWRMLRARGMHIGAHVNLPSSTWIDDSHCYLISIGDRCGFGRDCHILAHDAQMNEFLDAVRVGRVVIHESSHIGAHTMILPGVEIGPRTIVGARSVVSCSLPPETVCVGAPARVVCTLDEYLEKHRRKLAEAPVFPWSTHDISVITSERKTAMVSALATRDGYMTGTYARRPWIDVWS